MRRAIPFLILGLCVLVFLPPRPHAQSGAVTMIDGIGLIDYTRKPSLKIGEWTQYRISGHRSTGVDDQYMVTLLIGGEELFWGDEGFWVETWTETKARPYPSIIASLVSYAIFQDSFPDRHIQDYARKLVTETDMDGNAIQEIRRPPESLMRERNTNPSKIEWHVDTVGTDTVIVPRGTFKCLKIVKRFGVRATNDAGDSTIENEVEERRTLYKSTQIPITSLVREDIEKWVRRRAFKAGESQNAPLITREYSLGIARLLDYGSDMSARMVPMEVRKPLQRNQARQGAAPAAPRRTTGKKSG